ncbi:MAG: hypothetical protein EPN86_06470 [Nanoarchaeota archaeon]|nr:MAG: hypothetical protein EPN86_06470 [Nanoarchaeota archaeon]
MNETSTLQMKSVYEVVQESDSLAKQVQYSNQTNGKTIVFPHVSLYFRTKQQIAQFLGFRSYQYSHNIRGMAVPIDRAELLASIPTELKNYSQLQLDTLGEVFYYGSLKKAIYKRYAAIPSLPKKVVDLLKSPDHTQNWAAKDELYAKKLDTVFMDEATRIQLIVAMTNQSLRYEVDIINPFAPLIRNDGTSWHVLRTYYEQTRRLYLGDIMNVDETGGKRIALNLPIHKSVLSNNSLVREIVDYIKNNDHAAITLKVLVSDGSNDVTALNYDEALNLLGLLKVIGTYSKLKGAPSHLMCDNTLGLIAILHGFDSFSQPMNLKQLETDGGADRNAMLKQNPTYDFGRIYSHDIRKTMLHRNYIGQVQHENQLPCPARHYCGTLNPRQVAGLTRNPFWEHARLHLMEIRNYELDEVLTAIANKEVRAFRSRFNYFFNQFLLPA